MWFHGPRKTSFIVISILFQRMKSDCFLVQPRVWMAWIISFLLPVLKPRRHSMSVGKYIMFLFQGIIVRRLIMNLRQWEKHLLRREYLIARSPWIMQDFVRLILLWEQKKYLELKMGLRLFLSHFMSNVPSFWLKPMGSMPSDMDQQMSALNEDFELIYVKLVHDGLPYLMLILGLIPRCLERKKSLGGNKLPVRKKSL